MKAFYNVLAWIVPVVTTLTVLYLLLYLPMQLIANNVDVPVLIGFILLVITIVLWAMLLTAQDVIIENGL